MKYFAFVLLVAAIASGQTNNSGAPGSSPDASAQSAASQSIPVDQQNAQKAKALIDQMIQALGGEAYLNLQDISQEGRFYTLHHGESNSIGTPFVRFAKYPDKERVEVVHLRNYHFLFFSVGNVPIKDKSDIVLIHNGDKGYEITYKGTAAEQPTETADYLRRRRCSLDWVLRKWLVEPGTALFYDGSTVAAQKDAQQVTIMNSQNQSVTLYIDSKTHLPVKKTFSWRDPTDKERNVEDEVYDKYRLVQGVMAPFDITRYYNGDMSNQRFLNSVSYNKGLSDSMFEANVTYDPYKPAPRK